MLKKRSNAVCGKQGLMPDHISLSSTTAKFRTAAAASSLIPSTNLNVDFSPKGFLEIEPSAMSPTSILETKPFAAAGHHFLSNPKTRAGLNNSSDAKFHPWDATDSTKVGLGIVDALSNEETVNKCLKVETRVVFLGSQLKVQIPSASQNSAFPTGSADSPRSLIEFGVKNKNSQLAMALLSPVRRSSAAAAPSTAEPSPPVLCLSPSEIELSEDYTRVVSHGPNPKTIHIFDTCTLESCSKGFSPLRKEIKFSAEASADHSSDDFLEFCQSCRKKLGQGKDTYMYRGEKAFCSHECRSKEMIFEEHDPSASP